MITIFHGDNYVASRQSLNQSLIQTPDRFEAKHLSAEILTQALESNPLFQTPKLFVIENLLTLPRSKNKDQLIKIVLNNFEQNIFLWEKKVLTPAVKKQFSQATLKEFKLPASLFAFLDAISLKNFHQALVNNPVELIFYLLHRRTAQLIQALDDPSSLKGAPWQLAKLKTQLKKYKLAQLINFHQQLLTLDQQVKTGQTSLSLAGHLDLLLSKL
ncbi:MAG: hypothetical protein U0946_05010 [Patescibacteria group bacterium]|nr:hypothetical protein [Patescibacteria group bacterium]